VLEHPVRQVRSEFRFSHRALPLKLKGTYHQASDRPNPNSRAKRFGAFGWRRCCCVPTLSYGNSIGTLRRSSMRDQGFTLDCPRGPRTPPEAKTQVPAGRTSVLFPDCLCVLDVLQLDASRLPTLPQPLLQILYPRFQPLHGRLIRDARSNPTACSILRSSSLGS
jgi:hypothetical protein